MVEIQFIELGAQNFKYFLGKTFFNSEIFASLVVETKISKERKKERHIGTKKEANSQRKKERKKVRKKEQERI